LYLLEEEKLARDVYRALYEKWGERRSPRSAPLRAVI
jgi:hypothetical protein